MKSIFEVDELHIKVAYITFIFSVLICLAFVVF